jgi:hypothetical protein
MQAIESKMENLKKKKKNWGGRGTVTKRERRSEREGDLKKTI